MSSEDVHFHTGAVTSNVNHTKQLSSNFLSAGNQFSF